MSVIPTKRKRLRLTGYTACSTSLHNLRGRGVIPQSSWIGGVSPGSLVSE